MAVYEEYPVHQKVYGKITQTAATVIVKLVEPFPSCVSRITGIRYRVGANDHIITVMRPLNRVTFAADAAASQAVVSLSADPGVYNTNGTLATANNVIAASDYVVYQAADGTFVLDTVASGTGTAPTLTTNLPTGGVKKGDPLWFFGIVTDTNPNDALAHTRFNALASSVVTFGRDDQLGTIPDHKYLKLGNGCFQPLIIHSDNVTAAGFLESVSVQYYRKAAA